MRLWWLVSRAFPRVRRAMRHIPHSRPIRSGAPGLPARRRNGGRCRCDRRRASRRNEEAAPWSANLRTARCSSACVLGMRKGELFGALKADVNRVDHAIRVNRSQGRTRRRQTRSGGFRFRQRSGPSSIMRSQLSLAHTSSPTSTAIRTSRRSSWSSSSARRWRTRVSSTATSTRVGVATLAARSTRRSIRMRTGVDARRAA